MSISATVCTFLDYVRVSFSGAVDGDGEDYPLVYYIGVRMFGIDVWRYLGEVTSVRLILSPVVTHVIGAVCDQMGTC